MGDGCGFSRKEGPPRAALPPSFRSLLCPDGGPHVPRAGTSHREMRRRSRRRARNRRRVRSPSPSRLKRSDYVAKMLFRLPEAKRVIDKPRPEEVKELAAKMPTARP